ncbi:SARP family transcriptional regulator [Sphaerisporangium melleum]|uniref:SARP family transcriptional regulator n=1 Tax=Sphaerisporangium melleum TaxID=321316 RepID=A0A917RN56_9ACTN|nr:BTAD domain-containing putative transcriptional regulator [Sphaerisporangium melleum]GGL15649.1 SARP family transcriptional regulator [Sphaerisporangium melleum]GII69659.1 SARP family transcriptional regulator [Sphaerisporangium melleum]
MRFGILGPVEVRTEAGEPIPVAGPRPRALLALLLLDAGRPVSVARLIDGQYGDRPPADAAGAVQAHVSRLRRVLPPGTIEFHDAGYRLAADPSDVDAHRFELLAREGREWVAAGRYDQAAAVLREALALWRGPALADVADAPFAPPQASRLEELRLSAREDLAEAELALPAGTSSAELRRLVAAHPLRERLTGQLMRALHAEGQRAAALAVFADARRLLADELGADPSPQLSALHLTLLREGDGGGDAGEVRRRAPSRLPAPLTGFVGREDELARIDALRDRRLVTLTGPGGTGKTRLAVEAARRQGRETCFVDLSAAADDGRIALAVLAALGLRETGLHSSLTGGGDPEERLLVALADRELLLILDNCEHLVAGAAALTRRLLDACPSLAVLCTSREPLGITGETLVPVPPLAVPPPGTDEAAALGYPAVRLFLERAATVRPGVTMRPEFAEICVALEGLPLAIELAAARLRAFDAGEIAARLAEHGRFALLSKGDRTAAARHRTLHAVVDWSWSLLTPEEQALARRFSVFAGGATLSAVERVCGSAELLADLVDKSLVEAEGGRYRMLDTIRLFCAQRLEESGEQSRVRSAHAACYLDLARRADPGLRRAEQLDWLARLSAEHANLGAALRHAAEDEPENGLRLVAALSAYWWLSGRRGQATSFALRLLDRFGAEPPAGLAEEYVLCVLQTVPHATPERWARAEEIMRSLSGAVRYPFLNALWGMAAGPPGAGDVDRRARMLGADPWSRATSRLGESLLLLIDGETAGAERGLASALAAFGDLGERWGMAQAMEWLGLIAGRRGEWERARRLWARALDLHEQLGALDEMVDVLWRRAAGLMREGDLAAARADLDRAADLARVTGPAGRSPSVELGLGELARRSGDHDEARRRYDAALSAAGGGFGADGIRTAVHTALGRLAEAEGDRAEAERYHGEALRLARTTGAAAADLADVAEGCAGAALLTGAGERAAFLLGIGVALRGTAVAGDADVARVAAGATDLIGPHAFATHFAAAAALPHPQATQALAPETVARRRGRRRSTS